ncbi:hypothetical protein P8452_70433 [Trifolium repens]|nr:hypothetical protein P8452_70433 [Trifolium repens]
MRTMTKYASFCSEQREKRLIRLSKRHINNKRLIGASNAMLKTSMRSSGSVVWLGNKEIYKEKVVASRIEPIDYRNGGKKI